MEQTSSDSTIMIRHEPKKQIQKTGRGSKYRGVSKNGKKWQIQVALHTVKTQKGQIKTERLAARIFDKRIIFSHGLKAKTNYSYTKAQLQRLLASQYDLEEDEIHQSELDATME